MPERYDTTFDPDGRVLTTRLIGVVESDDVMSWNDDLARALDALPRGSTFAMILDLHSYSSGSIAAHKAMRTVIPDALARHGMRPAYVDLFDPRPEMVVASRPSARCVAFANVHRDADRMADYEERAGKPDQRFFSDIAAARRWIDNLS